MPPASLLTTPPPASVPVYASTTSFEEKSLDLSIASAPSPAPSVTQMFGHHALLDGPGTKVSASGGRAGAGTAKSRVY